MKRAEPAVPRHFLITVIAFVIAVMKLVIKRTKREAPFVFYQQVFIAGMCHRRARPQIDDMKDQMDGVAGNDPVNADG